MKALYTFHKGAMRSIPRIAIERAMHEWPATQLWEGERVPVRKVHKLRRTLAAPVAPRRALIEHEMVN